MRPLLSSCFLLFPLTCFALTEGTAAADDEPVPTRWYGGQTLAVDGAALTVFAAGVASDHGTAGVAGTF